MLCACRPNEARRGPAADARGLGTGPRVYNSQESGGGDYFVEQLYSDIASLATLHGMHARHHGFYRRFADRFPFGIYYAIEGDAVYVVAVIDLRRRPSTIRRDVKSRDVQ